MSILIKGIDMPRNGDCHHITIYDNGDTYMTTSNRLYETDRKDVEVAEIPTPHGRLGDLDVLLEESLKEGAYNYVDSWQIAEQPTIIEAEE